MGQHVEKISFTLEMCRSALEQVRLDPPSAERDQMISLLEGMEYVLSRNPDLVAEINIGFGTEA